MKPMRYLTAGLLSLGLSVAGSASAAVGSIPPANDTVIAVQDGLVTPEFTFDFGSGYELVTASLDIFFSSSVLTFDPVASTLVAGGMTYSVNDVMAELQDAADYFGALPNGDFSSFVSFFDDGNVGFDFGIDARLEGVGGANVPLSGTVVFKPVFHVAHDFASGSSPSYLAFEFDLNDPDVFSTALTVSPVPEPETWLLWLGGLGLMMGRLARRQANG